MASEPGASWVPLLVGALPSLTARAGPHLDAQVMHSTELLRAVFSLKSWQNYIEVCLPSFSTDPYEPLVPGDRLTLQGSSRSHIAF